MNNLSAAARPVGPGDGPRPILLLDEHIANKIAAGEVIERPASVVKELMENALDAGARRLEVEIKAGGKEYIRVTDDGAGIAPDQLPLAFERHATSKITAAHDLFDVGTLGFRGEALPSIAAVAEVEVRSRPPEAPAGVSLRVEGGRIGAPEPVGMPPGTTVAVHRLFFNTPARFKFLRSDGAERRRVADTVSRIALAWPSVAVRLLADGRELLSTPGDGRLDSVIGAMYGPSALRSLLPVDFEQDGLSVTGFVGKPDAVHGNRDRMSIFLNGRWIQSPSLLHAVQRGYETMLPPRRFPLAVLHLSIDPKAVDVNVHPAKAEVRFQDDGAVYRTVLRAVRYALLEGNPVGTLELKGQPESPRPVAEGESGATAAKTDPFDWAPGAPSETTYDAPAGADPYGTGDPVRERALPFPDVPLPEYSDPVPAAGGKGRRRGASRHGAMYAAALQAALGSGPSGKRSEEDGRTPLREMTVIGQLQRTFILGETPTGLWIVDQHVAHERILYERYLREGAEADGVQQLLVPVVVTLTPDRGGLVEQYASQLARLGFQLEPFGHHAYAVRGVPVALAKARSEEALTSLLEDILDGCAAEGGWNDHEAAAALSCKAAVKAGDPLTQDQMVRLLRQLAEAENPYACPHGRPVVIEVGRLDLERRFGRR